MVWGRFGKTVISLLFIKGFEHSIYQMNGYIFLFYIVQTRRQPDVLFGKYKLNKWNLLDNI